MSRGPCTYKRRDLRVALEEATAAVAAGLPVAAVRVNSQGEIAIVIGKPGEQESGSSSLDRELEEFEARHGQG